MNRVLRVVVLTAIYLLVLTSVHPGDVLVGVVLAVALVVGGRRIRPLGPPSPQPLARRLAGMPALLGGTLVDIVRSTWTTALWCVHPRRTPPGLVTIPIPPCPPTSAAAWGIRVGITPDTVVVELDEERGRMLLHVIDAGDPDAVRAEQLDSYRRRQRRVFP
jgi:multisubunit Na+/H+ antiporter MnhE subunit